MSERHEIRIVGSGGQGVVLAGVILAEAAGEYAGKHVVQTQSYGSRARGGSVTAEIVVSNKPIDYPLALCPDILVILDKTYGEEYRGKIQENGWTIIDGDEEDESNGEREVFAPIIRIAGKATGRRGSANMVAIGVISKFSRVFSEEGLREIIEKRVPPKTLEANLRAFEKGIKLGASLKRKSKKASSQAEIEEEI